MLRWAEGTPCSAVRQLHHHGVECVTSLLLLLLLLQVLSRDIRSLHQRRDVAPVALQQQSAKAQQQQVQEQQQEQVQEQQQDQQEQQQEQQELLQQQEGMPPQQLQSGPATQLYTVTLDGVEVTYSIDAISGHVTVLDAQPRTPG